MGWSASDATSTCKAAAAPRCTWSSATRRATLDRNVALVGRVVKGMELLSSLPRGSLDMGFYAKDETPLPINSIRLEADVPLPERTPFEVLRTDTPTFAALIESRRNRPEEFFKVKAERIEVCNVPIPARPRK